MSVSEPGKIITPWAESGLKNPIPPAANPATGRAGFDQGFSAINMTAKEAGGIPPFGQDFNGIFYEITNILRYMQAGGQPTFDAAMATAIGGYPYGAMIVSDDGDTVFINSVDSNSNNPNTGGAGWFKLFDITYNPASEANGFSTDFNIIIGNKPLPFPASYRDAIQVSRNINGKTDCHAFADKTDIQSVTDSGTYGTFDSQTKISHNGAQSHQFSFQDRAEYAGNGTLGTWGNIIWPVMSGAGSVSQRTDWEIKDVTGTGTIASHIGIHIRNLQKAASNVAINLEQDNGYTLYCPNSGGRMYHQGRVGFGVQPSSTAVVRLVGLGQSNIMELDTDSTGALVAALGDTRMRLFTNVGLRAQIKTSAGAYAFAPGTDNQQPCGDAANRWSVISAGTGTINTSDANEKSDPVHITDEVLDAWGGVSLWMFQWLDAIAKKGEDMARWHFGVIAQQIRDAFLAHGIDGTRFGLLCYDEWAAVDAVYNSEGEEIEPAREKGNRWGIRADQCLFLEAAYQRRRCERIERRLDAAGI